MLSLCDLVEIMHGELIMPYFSTIEAATLRGVCRRFHGVVTAYPWDDRDTYVFDLRTWAISFPHARYCKIGQSYAVLSKDLGYLHGMCHQRNLQRIDMVGNNNACFGDWGVHQLKGIRHLDLRMCAEVELSDLGLSNLKGIKTLYFTARNVTDSGMYHLKGIQDLSVDGDIEITDRGLGLLAPHLQQLSIGSGYYVSITDAPFVKMSALVELSLYGLTHAELTDRTLRALTGLTSLSICACSRAVFTGAGIRALAGVKIITISNMDGVTCDDSAIAALAGVERLDLSSCRGVSITDAGIAAIAGVRILSLADCRGLQISDEGFMALAGISTLDLSWNRGARIQLSHIGIWALRGIHMLDMTDTDLYFTADEIAPLTANGSYINTDLPEIEWLNGGQPHEDFEDFEDFDEFNEFEGDFDYAGEFHNDDD
jgi:hypothetical protein